MLKTMAYHKRRIQESIEMPTDLVPAPSGRITKLMKVASASGSKNIVAVEDDGLKWEQNESPDTFLPCWTLAKAFDLILIGHKRLGRNGVFELNNLLRLCRKLK